jgi:hypothetical protein
VVTPRTSALSLYSLLQQWGELILIVVKKSVSKRGHHGCHLALRRQSENLDLSERIGWPIVGGWWRERGGARECWNVSYVTRKQTICIQKLGVCATVLEAMFAPKAKPANNKNTAYYAASLHKSKSSKRIR